MFSSNDTPPPGYDESIGVNLPDQAQVARVTYFGSSMSSSASGAAVGGPALNQQGNGKDCDFGDRFDRQTTLAYNFDDRRQVSFKLGINNHGDSPVEVSHALIVFRYKFNTVKSPAGAPDPAQKCRYTSHWQGMAGSAYNELFLRDNNTVWSDLRDRGLDFWH